MTVNIGARLQAEYSVDKEGKPYVLVVERDGRGVILRFTPDELVLVSDFAKSDQKGWIKGYHAWVLKSGMIRVLSEFEDPISIDLSLDEVRAVLKGFEGR